jgi:tetratricopeptide (TPR) repeat protein
VNPAPFLLGLHGKVLYRAGDYENAKQYLEKAIVWDMRLAKKNDEGELGTQDLETILQKGTPRDERRTLDWLFLALCEAQLGNIERGRMIYHHAQEYRDSWDHDSSWIFQDSWTDYVLEEARLLLGVEEEKPEEDTEAQTTDK